MENISANGRISRGQNGREKRIGKYFVDGIDESTLTIYEYNKWVFYGHPDSTTAQDLYRFPI